MPEGDTLRRTAAGLAPHFVGRPVRAARVRAGGPQIQRVVGSTVTSVEAIGKNLLIRFDNGLELRTHLRNPRTTYWCPTSQQRREISLAEG